MVEVQPGGQLYIQNNTVVEDGLRAVYTLPQINAGTVPYISVSNSTFNKNKTAIFIDHNLNNFNGSFLLSNTLFTCRQLPANLYLGTMASFFTVFNLALSSPVNFHSSYLTVNTIQGLRSENGVKVVNNFSPGALYYFPIGVSANSPVVFDNLDCGSNIRASNVKVFGCLFQNMRGGFGPTKIIGTGITAIAQVDYVKLEVVNSKFYDLMVGIENWNYPFINIHVNDFDCSLTSQSFKGSVLNKMGYACIYNRQTLPILNMDWTVYDNLFYNHSIGIYNLRVNANTSTIQNRIYCNSFISSGSGTNTPYMNQGILWEEVGIVNSGNMPLVEANNFNGMRINAIKLNGVLIHYQLMQMELQYVEMLPLARLQVLILVIQS